MTRISRTYLFNRLTHRSKEDMKLELFLVGTEEELQNLLKVVESKCAESKP